MSDTQHGGRRTGAGRKPGSKTKNPSPERALLTLVKATEEAIREKDFDKARDFTQKLQYILSFIPSSKE